MMKRKVNLILHTSKCENGENLRPKSVCNYKTARCKIPSRMGIARRVLVAGLQNRHALRMGIVTMISYDGKDIMKKISL